MVYGGAGSGGYDSSGSTSRTGGAGANGKIVLTFGSSTPLPTDVSNLIAWYDSQVGTWSATTGGTLVTADNTAIARWDDQSGNGYNLTQATAANQPVYDAVRAMVVADIGNNTSSEGPLVYMTATTSSMSSQSLSIFVVGELLNLRRSIIDEAYQAYQVFALDGSGDYYFDFSMDGSTGELASYDGSAVVDGSIVATTSRCLFGWASGASNCTIWSNGSSSTVTEVASGSTTSLMVLGDGHDSVYAGEVSVKDILIYSATLTSGNVATLQSYAQNRGVQPSFHHVLAFDGDSLTHGFGSTCNRNYPVQLAVPPSVLRYNVAEYGDTFVTLSSEASTRIDPLIAAGQTNVLVLWAGTNDLAAGTSASTLYSDITSYISARHTAGWKVVILTITPRNDSAWDSTYETQRGLLNTSILGNAAGADGVVNLTTIADLLTTTNTTYFLSDQLHLTSTGYGIVAAAVDAVIDGMFGAIPANNMGAMFPSGLLYF